MALTTDQNFKEGGLIACANRELWRVVNKAFDPVTSLYTYALEFVGVPSGKEQLN